MSKATLAPLITAVCDEEANKLRSYCESKFPVGPSTSRMHAVTGERYVELSIPWTQGFDSAADAATAARGHFDRHAAAKYGTLYWRVVPEIARSDKNKKYAYYMRLLISNKPPIPVQEH